MITSLKQKIDELDKRVLVGGLVGVLAIGLGLYWALRVRRTVVREIEQPVKTSATVVQVSEGSESDEKMLIRVVNSLKKLIIEQNPISYQGVKGIYKGHYELSRKQFKTLTMSNRVQRRKLMDNLAGYRQELLAYEDELDKEHSKHLNAILAQFRIEEVEWVGLNDEAALQHEEVWDEFILGLENEELDSLREKAKPKLKAQILVDIEKCRLKKLQAHISLLKETFAELEPTDLYDLVEKWSWDVVYQQFRVEEEDIQYSIQQLPEKDRQKVEEYQEEMSSLMETLILNVSEDADEDDDYEDIEDEDDEDN